MPLNNTAYFKSSDCAKKTSIACAGIVRHDQLPQHALLGTLFPRPFLGQLESVGIHLHCTYIQQAPACTTSHTAPTYIHGNSTNFRPTVPLDLVFMVRPPGLQQGLVDPTPTSHYPTSALHVEGSVCKEERNYTLFLIG